MSFETDNFRLLGEYGYTGSYSDRLNTALGDLLDDTSGSVQDKWHKLFDELEIPSGAYNERLKTYLETFLDASGTGLQSVKTSSTSNGTFNSRKFFTADGLATSGDFEPITLRGDFRIKFKAVCSGAASYHVILTEYRDAPTPNLIAFNGGNLVIRVASTSDTVVGAVTTNKLLSVEVAREGMSVAVTVDGVQLGSSVDLPGDMLLDRLGYTNNGNYADNVISDLEIIDLDQPATRDILTFGGVNEYGEGDANWAPAGAFKIELLVVPQNLSTRQDWIGFGDASLFSTNNILIGTNASGALIVYGNDTAASHSGTVNLGEVNHVVYEWTGSSGTLTLNGVKATVAVTPRMDGSGRFTIGASPKPTDEFAHTQGEILDVKLHDLATPSNSRRYRLDSESTTTIADDYGSGNALTLNNIVSTDWDTYTRDDATGEWVGGKTIADDNYTTPANVLWRLNSGSTVSELDARQGKTLLLNNVVDGDWERMTRVGQDWLGSELVVNGRFDSDLSGWTAGANVTAVWDASGAVDFTGGGPASGTVNNWLYQPGIAVKGYSYRVNFSARHISGGGHLRAAFGYVNDDISISDTGNGGVMTGYSTTVTNDTATVPENFNFASSAAGTRWLIDNVSVRRILEKA